MYDSYIYIYIYIERERESRGSNFSSGLAFRLYTASGQDLALFCPKGDNFYVTSAICPHASEFGA